MKKTILSLSFIFLLSSIANAQFRLPELAYDYADYEVAIDAETMMIHHSRHHNAYVKNLNKAAEEEGLKGVDLEIIMESISRFSTTVRNNGGGHYNHSLFWEILSPNPTEIPDEMNKAIEKSFGSMEDFIAEMNKKTASQFGSGWGWLIVTDSGRLKIVTTANQDNPLMDVVPKEDRGTPILGIDVWEHAYYLRYQNARAKYLENIWQLIDWNVVYKKYEQARNK